MTTQLGLYNGCLLQLGQGMLASLSEVGEPRRILDAVYGDVLSDCLATGQWNFAMRSIEADDDENVEPSFGFSYAFEKPVDWVRTAGVSASETFDMPLIDYKDEQGYWFANVNPLYVRYVSDDAEYGGDLTLWTPNYREFVELSLARRIAPRVVQNEGMLERIKKDWAKAMQKALSVDAMNDPVGISPTGSWVNARSGGGSWSGRRYLRA